MICSCCDKDKPPIDYYEYRTTKMCKECHREYMRNLMRKKRRPFVVKPYKPHIYGEMCL